MTNVEIIKSKQDSSYLGFNVAGHSGYDIAGSDIVCAAVSFMTLNTINSIEELTADEISVTSDEERGYISCGFNKKPSTESELLLKSFELGMEQLSDKNGKYKDFVSLTIREV